MIWVLDIDGVITTNPEFFSLLIELLRKNGEKVIILTARNPKRKWETAFWLFCHNIGYDSLHFMPKGASRSYKTQAAWKVKMVKKIKPRYWVDDNFKIYKRDLGIDTHVEGVTEMEL